MRTILYHILTWILLMIPLIAIEIISQKYNITLYYYIACFIIGWNTSNIRKSLFKQ